MYACTRELHCRNGQKQTERCSLQYVLNAFYLSFLKTGHFYYLLACRCTQSTATCSSLFNRTCIVHSGNILSSQKPTVINHLLQDILWSECTISFTGSAHTFQIPRPAVFHEDGSVFLLLCTLQCFLVTWGCSGGICRRWNPQS